MTNRFHYISVILIFLLLFSIPAFSQNEETKISLQLQNTYFVDFADSINKENIFRIYYKDKALDSLQINLNVANVSMDSVLTSIFSNTAYKYSIDFRRNIYVLKNEKIATSIPSSFFDTTPEIVEYKPTEKEVVFENKTGNLSTLENKLIEIGNKTEDLNGMVRLSGTIREQQTGEAIIGAVVFEEETKIHAVTNEAGFYSMNLKKGKHLLSIQSTGMKNTRRNLMLYSNGIMNIELTSEVQSLREVVIEKEKSGNVSGLQMGQDKLTIKSIKQIPMVFGEADIVRAILLLPGVKTVGEASTGFNVRGGSTDQNLILFNDGTIYNPSHLFGFFSAFNPDIVKTVELFKSNIPAKYGGRLASVLDITSREGNKKKFSGSGGIGLLTGRLSLEGPIVKDKISFLVGGRTTYSNWILNALKNSAYSGSRASFYDLNAGINYQMNENNTISLTGYISKDAFRLKRDTTYSYFNQNFVLKWKRVFSNKLYSVFTGAYSNYQYQISSESNPVNAFQLSFDIKQYNVKADQTLYASNNHTIEFGVNSIYYQLRPGSYLPFGVDSKVTPDVLPNDQAWENAFYISDNIEVNQRLSLQLGLRYSTFTSLGPKKVYNYLSQTPKDEFSITDSTDYKAGSFIKTYHGPEIRASARFLLNENLAVKASYNTLRQYIHMLSNTTAVSPTDIWKLSDPNIRPTQGDQLSLGFYKNSHDNKFEISLEGYHKNIKNYLDYKGGAVLLQNRTIERDVLNTKGRAYGIEAYLKKVAGKLNGWVSYTYSRTLLQMDDPGVTEPINKGKWYPANFDKPHDFVFVGNYKFSHRFNLSMNVTYSTGRPITLPLSIYNYGGAPKVLYGERNASRIPDYFRMDFSMNIEGNHKVRKLAHSSWTIAIYNLTARRNAYSVYFRSENGKIRGHKLSIFGQAIPTVTYNFKF